MNRKAILTVLTSLALLTAASVRSRAQSVPAPPEGAAASAEQAPAPPPPPGAFMFKFRSIDEGFDGKVVTGVPYSADAVTERTQTLADGNRIVQKTTAHVFRDSQGRTRREQTLGAIGPWGAPADLPPITMINDPVAGVGYFLDARRKIAFKHPLGAKGIGFSSTDGGKNVVVFGRKRRVIPDGPGATGRTSSQISLGTQTIEGVEAQGTRETVTIAAGAIGNDQPIQMVTDRWYSPELQIVVMTHYTDPRFGDSVYRLTNVSRDEPAPSLFEVPPDYTVKEGPGNVRFGRKLGDK